MGYHLTNKDKTLMLENIVEKVLKYSQPYREEYFEKGKFVLKDVYLLNYSDIKKYIPEMSPMISTMHLNNDFTNIAARLGKHLHVYEFTFDFRGKKIDNKLENARLDRLIVQMFKSDGKERYASYTEIPFVRN